MVITLSDLKICKPGTKKKSRLLSLPAELRNMIFDYVRDDIDKATIRGLCGSSPGILETEHPLNRTCLQLRHEFIPRCTEQAAKNAKHIRIVVENFIHPNGGQVETWIRSLPDLPAQNGVAQARNIFQEVRIDNFFAEEILCHTGYYMLAWFNGEPWKTVIRYDPRSFDLHFCRTAMVRKQHFMTPHVLAALEEAIARYEAEAVAKKVARKKASKRKPSAIQKKTGQQIPKKRKAGEQGLQKDGGKRRKR